MNPTRKPKKPKQVVDKPKKTKSMKKGGGGWRREMPTTHRPSDIPWSTVYRKLRPPQYTTIDLLRDKAIESCNRFSNKIAGCIHAYNQWQEEKREEKKRKKRREERDKKLKEKENMMEMNSQQASQSHHSQSHSSHLSPIQEELQYTTRKKILIPLPHPLLQQPMRRKSLKPLPKPIQRSSPKK